MTLIIIASVQIIVADYHTCRCCNLHIRITYRWVSKCLKPTKCQNIMF